MTGASRATSFTSALWPLLRELEEVSPSTESRPWALFGSSVLLLHGLRERIGDVDVFAAAPVWEQLAGHLIWSTHLPVAQDPPYLERLCGGYTVHAFPAWTSREPEVDAAACRQAAEQVGRWWCTPLDAILLHKTTSVRRWPDDPRQEKHLADIEAITSYLRQAA